MFDDEKKKIERMAPLLQRVLIADPQLASAQMIGDLMRSVARSQVWVAPNAPKAMKMAAAANPQLVFVELSCDDMDGLAFTKALRRSTLPCRQAPVIMVTSQATAASILGARDAGVHEFLRKPFTLKDLLRRLEAVTLRQRDWVEAVGYVGPDRRRFNSGEYAGPMKRRSDARATPDAVRIAQALKILRSAVAAVDSDPTQALRAMTAQAAELQKSGTAVGDLKLVSASADLARYLAEVAARGGALDRAETERRAAPLLAYMPRDAQLRDAAA